MVRALQPALRTPSKAELRRLPSAADNVVTEGLAVWYWRDYDAPIVAGVFDRYGAARCAIYLTDAAGVVCKRWVAPRNVYAQAEAGAGVRSDGQ